MEIIMTGAAGGIEENIMTAVKRHSNEEDTMKSSNRDQLEGTFHEVKGTIKEVAGKLSDNPTLQVQGAVEKMAGKVQEKVGQVKKVLGK